MLVAYKAQQGEPYNMSSQQWSAADGTCTLIEGFYVHNLYWRINTIYLDSLITVIC